MTMRMWNFLGGCGKVSLPFQSVLELCVLIAQSCPTLDNNMDYSQQAPMSMEFSRQEYWSGLPFSSSGDLPHPGIEPRPPTLQAESLPSEPLGPIHIPSYWDPMIFHWMRFPAPANSILWECAFCGLWLAGISKAHVVTWSYIAMYLFTCI